MNFDEAKKIIRDFAYTQVEITKQANFRKNGVTQKIVNEEKRAVKNLLAAIIQRIPTEEEIEQVVND